MRRPLVVGLLGVLAALGIAGCGDSDDGNQSEDHPPRTFLFVQTADSAEVAGDRLVLTGNSPSTVFFADRPARLAGHLPTWLFARYFRQVFRDDPPNADLALAREDAGLVASEEAGYVVELRSPEYQRRTDRLTYEIAAVPGSEQLPPRFGPVAIFIDDASYSQGYIELICLARVPPLAVSACVQNVSQGAPLPPVPGS